MNATPVPPEGRSPNRLYVGLEYHERAVANAERSERGRMLRAIRRWRDDQPDDLAVHTIIGDLLENLEVST